MWGVASKSFNVQTAYWTTSSPPSSSLIGDWIEADFKVALRPETKLPSWWEEAFVIADIITSE